MRFRRTIAYFISVLVLILVILAAALFFMADRILNSDRVRTKVDAALSEAVSGTASYDQLDLGFFPLPYLKVLGLKMTFTGGSVLAKEIVLHPRYLPLLSGEFQIGSLLLSNPRLEFTLPEEKETPFDPAEIEKKLTPVFQTLRKYAPGLNLNVRSGFLKLLRPEKGSWVFQNFDLEMALSRTLEASVRCEASPWGPLSLKGRFTYRKGMLETERTSGSIGGSSVSVASARLEWSGPLRLKLDLGKSVLKLEEIETLTGRRITRAFSTLRTVGGTVTFTSASFDGPLENPSQWRYAGTGSVRDLVVQEKRIPEPIRIAAADFKTDQDSLSLHNAEARVLDSVLKLDVQLIYRNLSLENLFFSGTIGRKTIRFLSSQPQTAFLSRVVLPSDIAANGGISYRPGSLELNKLNLSTGGTSVSNLSGRLQLGERGHLSVAADRVVIVPGEFGDQGLRMLKRAVPEVKSIRGVFTFTSVRFEGDSGQKESWRYSASGTIRNAVFETPALPGPVRVPTAGFNVSQDQLSFQDARAAFLDSDLAASGRVRFENGKRSAMEVQFAGGVGGQSLQWAADKFRFPENVLLTQPFNVNGGKLSWGASGKFSLAGDFQLQPSGNKKALRLSFELDRSTEAIRIQKGYLKDNFSDASFSVDYGKDRVAAFTFSGSLQKQTLDALYRIEQPPNAWISGKLSGRIPLAAPRATTASGDLKAGHLQVPLGERGPLSIEALDLKADRNRFLIRSSSLVWQGQPLSLQGTVRMPPASGPERIIHLDADVRTERIDVDELTRIFEAQKKESAPGAEKTASRPFGWVSGLPVQGAVRIKADRLIRKKLALEPLAAEVSLEPERVRVFVTRAVLCGIPIPGTVEIKPGGAFFTFRTEAKNYPIAPILKCLAGERMGLTGFATFTTELEGTDRISESLWGDGLLVIRDGRIYRFNLITRILEFLNITRIVLGGLPDFGKKGMAYDVIRVRYRLEGNRLIMSRIALRGDTLAIAGDGTIDLARNTMNLTLLVSPLRTVDKILSKIPIVRNFRGILGVPVSVYGKLDSPVIVPLSPGAVGSHIFDLMKEAIELPFNLF